MKLGDALAERAAAQRTIGSLRERIVANATYQEGEIPAEFADQLIIQASEVAERIGELLRRINRTNSLTWFDEGQTVTVTDALAQRDVLTTKINILDKACAAASGTGKEFRYPRYGRSELKTVVNVDVAALREQIDLLQAERRELDSRLQRLSWETDLLD